jgi:selenide,water dikinase
LSETGFTFMSDIFRLTEYSHGAGCGCKISPKVLDVILQSQLPVTQDERLLVGNGSRDDAAVYDIGHGQAVISTTDFFMPIVDDAFDFGRIAATNAISDVYAMGGRPLLAIAILAWPINLLPTEIAQQVVEGGRQACKDAGIILAGGHSIDAPEPIFGLAVTGSVAVSDLKRNDTARPGNLLYLTKPLGVGILTTAQKQKKLKDSDRHLARDIMCQLNTIGAELGKIPGVCAMTDVTGFGLLGHLLEMCEGSQLNAHIAFAMVPRIEVLDDYLAQGCVPGGTTRNFTSYGEKVSPLQDLQRDILCDPQTSGGLLLAVDPEADAEVRALLTSHDMPTESIGELFTEESPFRVNVV